MKFELISDQVRASKKSKDRENALQFKVKNGSTVCYHQPIYEQPFNSLQTTIHNSNCLTELRGRFYKIESNGGYLHQYYPAVEYYKIAFRMIRDNIHTIRISLEEIRSTQEKIHNIYRNNKETPPGGQTRLSFDREIYTLRSHLFTFVFSVRATLDTIASLFQTIYGPKIGQHISFNGLMKHILGNKCQITDAELVSYLRSNMEWFNLLKDVRDYLAHFGAIHFSIRQLESNQVIIELFRNIEVNEFVQKVYNGFQDLLQFLDAHCTYVIKNA